MKNKSVNKKLLFELLFIFFIIFGGIILLQEIHLNTGKEVYLKTIPVDPRDFLRGDYVILTYQIQDDQRVYDIIENNNLSNSDIIYFILEKNQFNFASLIEVSLEKPKSNQLYIKGKVDKNSETRVDTNLNINKYFVPEKRGYEVERLIGDLDVLVSIDKQGNGIIKDIYYNNTRIDFRD